MYHQEVREMYHTHVRSVRDLRNNYSTLAGIVRDKDHIIITNNGKSESVLISYEEFSAYEEYVHVRYVEAKLAEAEMAAADSDTAWLSHSEFWEKVGELA